MSNTRSGSVELGNFRLLGLLGQGSFAAAYLAEQIGTDRQAVVKIAHPHLMERGDAAAVKARFLDEVRASTRIEHPNLATVFTAGETHDGLPAIAMEFVPGDSLEACLDRSAPLNPSELVYIEQLASVLAALHRLDIIHRDVSPSNVMVTRDHAGEPRAMLLDFGIAQLKDGASPTGAMGTPRYAAPEQIQGATLPASDMYALGSILWWALTGSRFLDTLKSIERLVSHQLHMTSAPDPRSVNQQIAPSLAEVTMALLDPVADKRPTARSLLDIWPDTIRSARSWRRRNRGRLSTTLAAVKSRRALRLLVIDPQPIKRHLVAGYAERLGCDVTVADDPRSATRGMLGTFDVAVMATELGGVDSGAIGRHLREHFPEQRLLLMSSSGERLVNCGDCDADLHLTLPGELGRLAEYLTVFQERGQNEHESPIRTIPPHEPLSATVMEAWKSRPPQELQAAIRKFVGQMPTLIIQLDGLDESTSSAATFHVCDLIEADATAIGALHLARLSKSLRMLLEAGELPDPNAFVAEIENEYTRVFRELRPLIQP